MDFLLDGVRSVTWQQGVMYLVGVALIWLAIKKGYEPALLLPMGFGAINLLSHLFHKITAPQSHGRLFNKGKGSRLQGKILISRP